MNPQSSLFLGPTNRPAPRPRDISYRCHLGNTTPGASQHHRGCDGQSYTANLVSIGIPCVCTCHAPEPAPCSE